MRHFFEPGHGRGRHRRGVFGSGFQGFDVRFERGFEKGFGGRWGSRTRRGDMKFLVLEMLAETPRHGYEIIGAIEEKRGFRPSAGSIYPTLQLLEDGGFVTSAEVDGKRVYTITDKGSELLAKHRETVDGADPSEPPENVPLIARGMQTMMGLKMVIKEIARTRNPEMYTQALAIIERARRDLYALLTHE